MTDRTPTILEAQIIRTLKAKAAQLDDLDGAIAPTRSQSATVLRPHRRQRRTVLLLVAILVLVVVGATVAVAESRYSIGSGVDGLPSRTQVERLAQERKDYDPAEIQLLLKQVGGESHTNDQELVGVLEFRRACRETQRALTVAGTVTPTLRSGAVDAIMDPELERLVDREPSDSQASEMFRRLADEIKTDDTAAVRDWLQGPRGNCKEALNWRP